MLCSEVLQPALHFPNENLPLFSVLLPWLLSELKKQQFCLLAWWHGESTVAVHFPFFFRFFLSHIHTCLWKVATCEFSSLPKPFWLISLSLSLSLSLTHSLSLSLQMHPRSRSDQRRGCSCRGWDRLATSSRMSRRHAGWIRCVCQACARPATVQQYGGTCL